MSWADLIEEYRIDDIGAPFGVLLERSVGIVHGVNGPSPVIPDLPGLIYETTAARVRHPRRLLGADVKFVRRALEISREDLGRSLGSSVEEIDAFENGQRPIPSPSDRLLRIFAYHGLRERIPRGTERMLGFLDWIFEKYRYNPMLQAGQDLSFSFRYEDPGGWTLTGVD